MQLPKVAGNQGASRWIEMHNRLEPAIVAMTAILLLSGCSETDSEQSRYTRESLRIMDRNCIKDAVEAQMQQAADYSRSRVHDIRGDSDVTQESGTGNRDVTGATFDDCIYNPTGSR